MSGYTQLKAEDALESLRQLEAALVEQARSAPGLAALWIVVTLAAVVLLVVRRRQWTAAGAPGWEMYAVCLFGVLVIGTNVGAVVLTGQFDDASCLRYVPLPLLFPFLGLSLAVGLVPRET